MSATNNFLIQKHDTPHPHYDLYLQIGEELKSWIIPNNIPSVRKKIKIAIESEPAQHAISDAKSKKVIEDAYGKGKTKLWDQGEFDIVTQWKTKLILKAQGKELNGTYLLHIPNWGRWTKKRLWTLEKIR
ncbi:MAG: hypothetical protein DHS20C13_09700 [Thermodesulfobacteriota bacterium]|nr:MAG: hypothetical protein DHS20C13_09700 [Thermodesulfobacteriota bacterium]